MEFLSFFETDVIMKSSIFEDQSHFLDRVSLHPQSKKNLGIPERFQFHCAKYTLDTKSSRKFMGGTWSRYQRKVIQSHFLDRVSLHPQSKKILGISERFQLHCAKNICWSYLDEDTKSSRKFMGGTWSRYQRKVIYVAVFCKQDHKQIILIALSLLKSHFEHLKCDACLRLK